MINRLNFILVYTFSALFILSIACGKGGGTDTPPNPCAGVTVTVTGTVTNPTTPGGTNGSISVNASGGSGFTFSINGGTFQSSTNFAGLRAGNYSIVAKNSSGCSGTTSFNVTDPPNVCAGITITVTGTITNPSTPGGSNGSIVATATGSSGFTFNINNGTFQATGNFTGLVAGNYTINAKDANGCTGTAVFTLTDPNLCSGVTITVNTTNTSNTPCEGNTASITITPSGGTGPYTYSLNSGAFQSGNVFSNLSTANHSIVAKDANGCTGTKNVLVGDLPAGPLFTAVRTLVQNNCVTCHNPTQPNGGMNFSVDCNIVANKDRIKARAVDANPSPMPQGGLLPASERQKITDWINAGGKFTN